MLLARLLLLITGVTLATGRPTVPVIPEGKDHIDFGTVDFGEEPDTSHPRPSGNSDLEILTGKTSAEEVQQNSDAWLRGFNNEPGRAV